MSGLGDLVVNLSANTQGFDKGIDKAKTGLNEFGKVGPRSVNPVTRAFSALTAVAVGTAGTLSALSLDLTKGLAVGMVGVGAAAWGLQSRIGDLAGVADKAAQTGLSGAFLQRIEFAADQSGVSAETLTGGIKKLTIMIGQASSGSKEAADSLKSFGLNAKDLQTLSPEQQFLKIADKISDIPTAAGRAAAAVKIFGKSGIEMTGLFAGGLDDVTKLMQDAKEIGIGLDDEQLAQIASADDSLQKMYASISAMVDQVAVGLAPAFEAVATEVTGLVGPVTKLFDTFNNLDDRWTWASDTLVASFDVAMETIKAHWGDMVNDMIDVVTDVDWSQLLNPFAGININDLRPDAKPENLQAAQAKLDDLLGQFNAAADENKPQKNVPKRFEGDTPAINNLNEVFAEWDRLAAERSAASAALLSASEDNLIAAADRLTKAENALMHHADVVVPAASKAVGQERFNSGVSSLFDKIKDSASGGLLSDIGNAAGGMLDRAKIQAGAMGGMLDGWFGSFDEKKNQRELKPQLAGAMQAGSVEAYSTLVQAMMTRGKDPVVAATEKQTKELIKGLKPKREFKNIESFVSL